MYRWGVLYSYTSEVYPTKSRTLGFGISSSFGRLGGAMAPLITGAILEYNQVLPLYISTGMLSLCALLIIALPLETKKTLVY